MRIFSVPLTPADLRDIGARLQAGGIALIPTDTVYGVAAAPAAAGALARIIAAKGRDPAKPCQLLAENIAAVEACAGHPLSAAERKLADAFWPGALTLVVQTPHGTEGFRIPDDAAARAICHAAGGLLRCTSANHSGEPDTTTAEAARAALPGADLLVDGGPCSGGAPSSVVTIAPDGSLRIFREAALSAATLRAALQS